MRVCTKAALGIGQHRGHGAPQPVGRRHEVGVEHRDIGGVAERHAGRQRPRLEAGAVGAAHMVDIDAVRAQAGDGMDGDIGGEIGAVVEQLDR